MRALPTPTPGEKRLGQTFQMGLNYSLLFIFPHVTGGWGWESDSVPKHVSCESP